MLGGAIIGGIIGLVMVFVMANMRATRFKSIMATVTQPVNFQMEAFMAKPERYKKSWKIYDSYGAFYVAGNKAYYQAGKDETPIEFDLSRYTVVREADWRKLKWFSVSSPVGEKYYFTSYKMGMFVNNSDEVLRALQFIEQHKKSM